MFKNSGKFLLLYRIINTLISHVEVDVFKNTKINLKSVLRKINQSLKKKAPLLQDFKVEIEYFDNF